MAAVFILCAVNLKQSRVLWLIFWSQLPYWGSNNCHGAGSSRSPCQDLRVLVQQPVPDLYPNFTQFHCRCFPPVGGLTGSRVLWVPVGGCASGWGFQGLWPRCPEPLCCSDLLWVLPAQRSLWHGMGGACTLFAGWADQSGVLVPWDVTMVAVPRLHRQLPSTSNLGVKLIYLVKWNLTQQAETGREVRASDLKSVGCRFKSHSDQQLMLFSAKLVNSQLVCLPPVGILNPLMFI